MTLREAQHVHIVGIGGIGVSALAKWALEQGKRVTGSDVRRSEVTDWLQAHGVRIAIGPHQATNLPVQCELVLHTVAVHEDNPERHAAAGRGITILTYPQALNELLQGAQSIAVAGTHGKSTTTAILATILVEAQRDPTVVVGTKLRLFGNTNERTGAGREVLVEADEFNQGILLYQPEHAIVLNVDREHVDVYPTLAAAQQAFAMFVSHVPATGTVTLNADDPSFVGLRQAATGTVQSFGLSEADIVARDIVPSASGTAFTVSGFYAGMVQSQLFGKHNVQNVLAALCVAHALQIPFPTAQRAVAAFPGTWRRFERRGEWQGATLVDDYAHHPTEIAATLQAARQAFPGKRQICVFQPHLHSRTIALASAFQEALAAADAVVLLKVYDVAGREAGPQADVAAMARAIGPAAIAVAGLPEAVREVAKRVQPGDVILTLGAGDVTDFAALVQKETPPR